MNREFILFSRTGKTNSEFRNLHDAGRLDIVHECVIASLFLSHGIRKNAIFNVVLNGPPDPPLHIEVDGAKLCNARTDIDTWEKILRKVISGKHHPGLTTNKKSYEALIKTKAETSRIFVLEEGGKDIAKIEFSEKSVFVLGDHVGLPKKTEAFTLRYGEKISLGKKPYLAASCITILNYHLDHKIKSCF